MRDRTLRGRTCAYALLAVLVFWNGCGDRNSSLIGTWEGTVNFHHPPLLATPEAIANARRLGIPITRGLIESSDLTHQARLTISGKSGDYGLALSLNGQDIRTSLDSIRDPILWWTAYTEQGNAAHFEGTRGGTHLQGLIHGDHDVTGSWVLNKR